MARAYSKALLILEPLERLELLFQQTGTVLYFKPTRSYDCLPGSKRKEIYCN